MNFTRLLVLAALALALPGCPDDPKAIDCGRGFSCPEGFECAASQQLCIEDGCGNAIVEAGETCDDGNVIDGDGCSHSCQQEGCGNSQLDPGEQCDDGNTVEGDGCSPGCTLEICGNGIKDFGEACDDGNNISGDGCAEDCKSAEVCGNGIKDVGEICDDGDTPGGCNDDCLGGTGCGDGSIDKDANGDPLEECDDGNANPNDDCHDCRLARCGDGIVQTSGARIEDCDFGSNNVPLETSSCNLDCSARVCGDGKVNTTAGEQCDDGVDNADDKDCTSTCVVNVCGDGHANTNGHINIEQCDDGNAIETDGCTTSCTSPSCGNGIVDQGEECDLGSGNSDTGACLLNCKISFCGDGKTRTNIEQCDDGNNNNNDGCSSTCRNETCGNGIRDNLEACDDGNNNDGDGCSHDCVFETCGDGIVNNGEDCDDAGESADCNAECTTSVCGDGKVNNNDGEECDNGGGANGNLDTNDCKSNCKLNVCGDGKKDSQGPVTEACDDGNQINNDGCNVGCTLPSCGNGIVDQGEQCDLGAGNDNAGACLLNCHIAFCGDGQTRGGGIEACDDGDTVNGNGCDNNCTNTGCGNGIKTAGEACDDGNTTNGDGCSSTCTLEKCGNGVVDSGEQCDPGVAGENASCNRDCTNASCGDGKVNVAAGEECDDGNAVDTDDCLTSKSSAATTCKLNRCGDGKRDATGPDHIEACDDGNQDNTDGCTVDCRTTAVCGNGIREVGEQCDDGNTSDNDTCLSSSTDASTTCKNNVCGDGHPGGSNEQCDNGVAGNGATKHCLANCKLNTCGDGFLDTEGSPIEVCDDGNTADESTTCPYNQLTCNAGCNSTCTATITRTSGGFCGDGVKQPADEVCDDGNRVTESSCDYGDATCDNVFCQADCQLSLTGLTGGVCGDGNVDAPFEACDDHNANACGTCDATCQTVQTTHASGFLFAVDAAQLADGQIFTIDDGINGPTVFEFDTDGSATGVAIDISVATGATTQLEVRDAIVGAINGEPGTLLVTAASNGTSPFISLTHDQITTAGNQAITTNSAIGVFGMSGGQGGDCTNPTSCNIDDDCTNTCVTNVCQ